MATTLNPQTTAWIAASGLSTKAKNAISDAAAKSPYFAGMLDAAANQKVTLKLGAANGGTFSDSTSVFIDPTWQPGSNKNVREAVFATIIAHELGHILLPGGNIGDPISANPDRAVALSRTREGSALVIDARQIKLSRVINRMKKRSKPLEEKTKQKPPKTP